MAALGWAGLTARLGSREDCNLRVLTAEGTVLGLCPKAHDTSQGGLGLQAVARISAFHQEPLGH